MTLLVSLTKRSKQRIFQKQNTDVKSIRKPNLAIHQKIMTILHLF